MKRFLLGFAALTIAIVGMSFTTKNVADRPNSYTFYFTGSSPTQSLVEDESKWSLTNPGNTCSGDNNKACSMVVDDNQTEVISGTRRLKSSLNIVATPGDAGSGTGYVPQLPHTGISSALGRP